MTQNFSWKLVPKSIKETFFGVRDRIQNIIKKYGSLNNYGYPVYEDIKEIAVIYGLMERFGLSESDIANELGLNRVSIYRLKQKIKQGKKVSILKNGKVEQVQVNHNMLIDTFNRLLEARAKKDIADITQSKIVQEFIKNPRRRWGITKHGEYFDEREIKKMLGFISRIANYIRTYHPELPSNPDLWSEEMISKILDEMAKKMRWRGNTLRSYKIAIRTVINDKWFTNRVGAAVSVANPKETYLPYEILQKILDDDRFGYVEKLYLKLHITTGAREGYSAKEDSSMWGLKWSYINWRDKTMKIYESKTRSWWKVKLDIFFRDLPEELYSIWLKNRRPEGRIWETFGLSTVNRFKNFLNKLMRKIEQYYGNELQERFGTRRLVPHDLRRTHVVYLIEAGVDLQYIARAGEFELGVGWEDLNTLLVYYARFTERRRALEQAKVYMRFAGTVPDELLAKIGVKSIDELKQILNVLA